MILDESDRKWNTILVEKGIKFYNRTRKSWLEDFDFEIYSTCSEGNQPLQNALIKPARIKIDKLPELVEEYNNIINKTVRVKSFWSAV